MRRRLFIAVNFPENIREKIERTTENIPEVPGIRFSSEDNWYVTVVFLGEQEEEFIPGIINAMKDAAGDFASPLVKITNIAYGPSEKAPRMIWLNGDSESSEKLSLLRDKLNDELFNNKIRFKQEMRSFKTHITLARIQGVQDGDLPSFENIKGFPFSFQPQSLDLMESSLSHSGAEYAVLQKVDFKQE
ncbi:MAG: RNA 2',3'-cyclic phosphodiesterase [Candidatus Pacebacteria bacterium]|nr:RNA 2',3'-cyclic phosphodiesterase [Candidatus Paceibacterota bacterium]